MNYLPTRRDFSSLLTDVFFRDFFGDDFFSPIQTVKKIDYPVDIYETNEGLNIDIAAIGLEKQDIKVDIKNDVITVEHQSNQENKTENSKCAYRGITRKSFRHAWRISDKFDLTKTQAELDKGLLKISIPLAPEKKSKEIEIKIK